jgi:hypothetical protein
MNRPKVLGIMTRLGSTHDRVKVSYLLGDRTYLTDDRLCQKFGVMLRKLLPVCLANAPGNKKIDSKWRDRGRVIAITIVWDGLIVAGYRCCCGYAPKRYRVMEKIVTEGTKLIEPCSLFWDVFDYAEAIATMHQSNLGTAIQLSLFK